MSTWMTFLAEDKPVVLAQPAREMYSSMKDTLRPALDWLIASAPNGLAAFGVLVLGWVLSNWARRMVIRGFDRAKIDITLGKFFGNLTRWTILAFAVVTFMGQLGISTHGFTTILAASGLAVALALQGNLTNLACGVLLLIFRPFKIGDAVIVAGTTGIVDGIDLFTTNLDTGDNRRVIIPNSSIFGGVIENQTRHPRRRADVNVPIAGTADIEQTRKVLGEAVERVLSGTPGALREPAPGIAINEIAPMSWSVNVWAETSRHGAVRQALLQEIKLGVDGARIGPPGQSMDVRITAMPSTPG